jgi:hypothetical protein
MVLQNIYLKIIFIPKKITQKEVSLYIITMPK